MDSCWPTVAKMTLLLKCRCESKIFSFHWNLFLLVVNLAVMATTPVREPRSIVPFAGVSKTFEIRSLIMRC